MDERERRIEEVFHAALELSETERTDYVRGVCGEDETLASEVFALLLQVQVTDDILDVPAAQFDANQLLESAGYISDPREIGPYRIERTLGSGGWGVVYLASQETPVRRKVALKVLRKGADLERAGKRFEAERQALALLDHPGIATVFDAGALPDGRPYFAMEYIPGLPITEFCDSEKLDMEARLRLFRQVCDAVQHAHQKGILHRDLKPSNVMVRLRDGQPAPVVIDFGLAKALHQPLTEDALETHRGSFLGTLEYASPEQIMTDGLDVDTRADVYSLGVILYSLLSGELPIDSHSLRQGGLLGVQRIVSEFVPSSPSKRAASSEGSLEIARLRGTDPHSLKRRLQGDLDDIVLMALEKERSRRYASVSEFSADIGRHLANEPVLAVPPDLRYRLGKALRRHRGLVVATITVFLVLVAGVVGSATGWRTALAQRDRARDAEEDAKSELAVSEAINEHLSSVLSAANPWSDLGLREVARETRVVDVLGLAAERLNTSFAELPVVRSEVQRTVGTNYMDLGLWDEAEQQLRLALQTQRTELGSDDARTIKTVSALSEILNRQDRFAEAEGLGREALEWYLEHLGEDHEDTLNQSLGLAQLARSQGRLDEAQSRYLEIQRISVVTFGAEDRRTLEVDAQLAILTYARGEFEAAVDQMRVVYEVSLRVFGPLDPDTINSQLNYGSLLSEVDREVEAGRVLRKALDACMQVHGEEHPETLNALNNLAQLHQITGDFEAARPMMERAIAISSEVRGRDHAGTLATRMNLGLLRRKLGELVEAEAELRACWEAAPQAHGDDVASIAEYGQYLAYALSDLQRFAEAEDLFREVLAMRETSQGLENRETIRARGDLGGILLHQERYEEAEEAMLAAFDVGRASLPKGDDNVFRILSNLVYLYEVTEDPEQEEIYRTLAEEWLAAAQSGD